MLLRAGATYRRGAPSRCPSLGCRYTVGGGVVVTRRLQNRHHSRTQGEAGRMTRQKGGGGGVALPGLLSPALNDTVDVATTS